MPRQARVLIPIGALSILAALMHPWPKGGDPAEAIPRLVGGSGCPEVVEGSFRWVGEPDPGESGPMDWRTAVFLGRLDGGLRDVWAADFRVTSDGRLMEIRRLTNLSRSADADEDSVVSSGDGKVAFAARYGGGYDGFSLLDFGGEPEALTAGWSAPWRLANGITNLQRTGQVEGIHWRTYLFREPTPEIGLRFEGDGSSLEVSSAGGAVRVLGDGEPDALGVSVQEMAKGRPAALAWAVDTVREIPWVGRRKIEWLEKYWFDFNDWLARTRYDLVGDDEQQGEGELRVAVEADRASGIPGWPPPDLAPMLKKARSGEGVWIPVEDERFTRRPGGIPLFYQTFLRSDPERPFASVHMTAWDPAGVELRMMAGVREPISTTGVKGKGEVPRKGGAAEDEIARLVGAFNGAFQALHGEWGMVQDHKILLPPRAYGATVSVWDDGRVSMGTWPHPVGDIPEDMRDLRQNVQPLVEGGALNPYRRKWWGGVPEGVEERVVTTRSGFCLTGGGKMIYFWGNHLSPEALGEAMLAAGCDYGIHLDMNAGHCGFEYYRVDPVGENPEIEEVPEGALFAKGAVPRRSDLEFVARKMVREMGHMRFPRYIGRDPRDFFYLLERKTIFRGPGGPLAGGGRTWSPLGAKVGYPTPAIVSSAEGEADLYRIDPSQTSCSIREAPGDGEDAILSIPFVGSAGGFSAGLVVEGETRRSLVEVAPGLSVAGGIVSVWSGKGVAEEETVVQGVWPTAARQVGTKHMFGLDSEGYLVVAADGEVGALAGAMESMGVEDPFGVIPPSGLEGEDVSWLVIAHRGSRDWFRMFTEVKPVSPEVWRKVFVERGRLLDHEKE